MQPTGVLVLVRHGESILTQNGRWAGWTDANLSPNGWLELDQAVLKLQGHTFHFACSSILQRSVKSLRHVLNGLDMCYLETYSTWRLNERHYGALEGEEKKEVSRRYGAEQVQLWRRDRSAIPPSLEDNDERRVAQLERFRELNLPLECVPRAESPMDCMMRVKPFYEDWLWPRLIRGQNGIIVAHGGSLRGLIALCTGMNVSKLEIPTGVPIVLSFQAQANSVVFKAMDFLEDHEILKQRQQAVATQHI